MSRTITVAQLAPMSLAGFVLAAAAQEDVRNSIRGSSFRDIPVCQRGSASRANACDPEAISATRSEREIRLSVDPPAARAQCRAEISTEYVQLNARVSVESKIDVEGCAVAAGEHVIAARILGADGRTTTLEFSQNWQREGEEGPVTLNADYPIGDNVELLDLRVRGVRCDCVEQAGSTKESPVDD